MLSCETGLGDCTADPPKDGSATVFKAETRRTQSKEFLVKNSPISANSVVNYFFTENPEQPEVICGL
jgi:hypothetical protein